MAKDQGKKLERNGQSVGQPSATIIKRVNLPSVSPVITTSEPESHSGFIFMCNSSTKLECYQYRVFGLPLGKKEVVEEIKPGAKLFLYDFQLKLLYGIYEATSAGKMNLEPAAFGGKFPAQVNFRIFKECFPLPERILRNIIKENYTGYKFKQELSRNQVKNLVSSFRPLTASSQTAPHALSNVSLSRVMGGSLPAMEAPYLGEMRYNSCVPAFVEPQHVSYTNILPHGYQKTSAVNLTSDLQSLASAISYYVGNPQQPAFTQGVAHWVQEPSFSRYPTVASDLSNQVTDSGRQFHQLPLQTAPALYNTSAAAYQDNPAAASSYTCYPAASSSSQYPAYQAYNAVAYNANSPASSSSHPYQGFNSGAYNSNPAPQSSSQYAAYQDYNAVPFAPSATQPHAGVSQYNAVPFATSATQPHAGVSQYNAVPFAPSASQPHAGVSLYNSVPFAPSATQPHAGVSQGNDPASVYYPYFKATQLSR